MRYFRRHLDRFEGHVAGRQRVTFKTMFDDLSPGFYGKYYGQRFSEALNKGSVETTPPVLREAS
jgi:hypothetical protein